MQDLKAQNVKILVRLSENSYDEKEIVESGIEFYVIPEPEFVGSSCVRRATSFTKDSLSMVGHCR